ncbi:MAG: class I SAM-dependent methyltransferase [bacterium]
MKSLTKRLIGKVRYFLLDATERRHALVGPPELWKMKRDFQIHFLKRVGLQPQHFLLDIGCGTLRGGIPIIQYLDPGHYFGIESREEVLTEGQRELVSFKLTSKEPRLICEGDFSSINLKQTFDFVWAFSVFIHMTDDIVQHCLKFVEQHLKMAGAFYANVNIGENNRGNWQGFPVVYRPLEFYQEICINCHLRVQDIGSLADYGHRTKFKAQNDQRILKITRQ